MSATVVIGGRRIGGGEPCFVIAEAGVNHNGDLELALKLIDVAAAAGADAVKFQTFSADRLASASAPKAPYQQATTEAKESQHAMLKRLELKPQAYARLMEHCRERGIMFCPRRSTRRPPICLTRSALPLSRFRRARSSICLSWSMLPARGGRSSCRPACRIWPR